jgi:alkylation response protein AidB-like acyl-CoA dehydrogenase
VVERDNELVGPVREFLDRSLSDERRLAMLESNGDDPKFLAEAAALGWFALTAPEAEDGLGLHPAELAPVFRAFGERLLPGPMLEQMLVPGLLMASASDAGQESGPVLERIRPALAGEVRVAVADPGVTTDWAQAVGGIRAASDRLDGTLELVRFGAEADELVLVAADESRPLVLLVNSDRAGLTVTARPSADPGARFASVRCDGVAFTSADVVARGAAAEDLVTRLRTWQRILVSCELAGIARRMLDLAVEYVQQREQFGRTIATFQVVRQMAATAAQRVILLENFCDAVAQDAPRLGTEELMLAAMTLKVNAAEFAPLVVEDALQMHGGIGFTYEYELHWYYKRVLALRTWYGDERELAVEVGRRRLFA